MKKLSMFFVFLFIPFLFISCSKGVSGPGGTGSFSGINGKVENWTLGIKTLRLNVYSPYDYSDTTAAVTTINSDGTFNFSSLPVLTNNGIGPVRFNSDSNCTGTVTVTPNDLKAGDGFIYVYTGDSVIGYITRASSDHFISGIIECYYEFFAQSGSIIGNKTCYFGNKTYESNWNVTFPANWNAIYQQVDSLSPDKEKRTITTNEPSNLKWYFTNYSADDNSKVDLLIKH